MLSVCTNIMAESNEKKKSSDDEVSKEQNEIKSKGIYKSEEEFDKYVMIEVEKYLKKIGQGRMVSFAKELMALKSSMKIKELEIDKKYEELQITKKHLEKKIKKFRRKQSELIGCLSSIDDKKEKRIKHMVEIISGLKPNVAAKMLSVQDIEITVRLLEFLPAKKVSKIFNLMDQEISARLQKQYLTMKRLD